MSRAARLIGCLASVAVVTFVALRIVPVNATTVGFAYLLLILVIASTWGFLEAALSSLLATVLFNVCFLPPVGTLTIADPQNWIALFSFLATSLLASRLSDRAKRRAIDALQRQEHIERLYTFSRSILLIGREEPFPAQLIRKLAETFNLSVAVLYDRRSGEFYQAGAKDFNDLNEQLRDAALNGTAFTDSATNCTITAVRLGSEPIASLALQGIRMPDSVLQGIGNLVAIGLERAKAQDLEHQVEVARQSERLRTTLIDAMAHEFKTPLTVIKGVTTSVLASEEPLSGALREQLTMADEEADHLKDLVDNAVEMARLDTAHIDIHEETCDVRGIVDEVIRSMQTQIEGRRLNLGVEGGLPRVGADKRLIKLAFKQLLDNALKYSPPETPVDVHLGINGGAALCIDVTDRGPGIRDEDRARIFERFYRGQSIMNQIPGSGLGLNIAYSIMKAHQGNLTFTSRPGETRFRMTLPVNGAGEEQA